MKRTPLNKIGRVGKANLEANRRIREQNPPAYCEINLEGCLGFWPLAVAHRHKRSWYKGNATLLSDLRQYVIACNNCHDTIENDPELTKEVFSRLRGEE